MGVNVEEHLEDVEIQERLAKLKIDLDFVVDPEHRPGHRSNSYNDKIPVIDLNSFMKIVEKVDGTSPSVIAEAITKNVGDDESIQNLIADVGKACQEWGFFQVINHGVPPSLLEDLEKVAREFFQQPLEQKRKIRRTLDNFLGYYDSELTKNKRDWKEVFDFASNDSLELPVEVVSEHCSEETVKFLSQWPPAFPDFRIACMNWRNAVHQLASNLMGLISQSLGLRFDYFHSQFEQDCSSIRLNYYTKCPIPNLALGVSRHKDPGALTVLVQDEVGGLQVRRKDGEWISVQPRRDAFVINLGDLFQVWTNDLYCSVEHRVVVNENRDRFSCPFFYNPSCKTLVQPVQELLDDEHPPRYRCYPWGLFMKVRNDGNFKQLGDDIQIYNFVI